MDKPKSAKEIFASLKKFTKKTTNPLIRRMLLDSAYEMLEGIQKPKQN